MRGKVPRSLYWPDTTATLTDKLKKGLVPDSFLRRMRLINLMSAVVLRKIEPELLAPFDVHDLHHILDKQISHDAVIDQLKNKSLAEALKTGDLRPLWDEAQK